MKIEIKCRFSGKVLFEHAAENNTTRLSVEAAVKAGAYLAGANLAGAYLDGAYLAGANLDGANLAGAYLDGAYLAGANLDGANLDGAKLQNDELLKGERPIIQIGPIGSRCSYFIAYLTDKGIRLKAGCFFGTVPEFKKKLKAEHDDNIHAKEYAAALKLVKAHADIWMPE